MSTQIPRMNRRQKSILARLWEFHQRDWGPESGPEMGEALVGVRGFTAIEQAQRTAKQLAAKGLAEPRGYTLTGARTYGITDYGIKVFMAMKGDGE